MKNFIRFVAVTALFIAVAQAGDKHGKPGPSNTQSLLWLVGDSSLHAYSSTANNLVVDLGAEPNVVAKLKSGQLKTLKVTVPVKDMRSGRNGLDKNMQKSLKAEQNPNIVFQMEKYEVVTSSEPLQVKAEGQLEVAGVKQPVVINATLKMEEDGVRLEGTKELLMTDYGIKPPKILMIKTTNDVKVCFDLRLDANGNLK